MDEVLKQNYSIMYMSPFMTRTVHLSNVISIIIYRIKVRRQLFYLNRRGFNLQNGQHTSHSYLVKIIVYIFTRERFKRGGRRTMDVEVRLVIRTM